MKWYNKLWQAIKNAFTTDVKPAQGGVSGGGYVEPVEQVENPVQKLEPQKRIYNVAKSQLGVKESLVGSNPVVEKYHAYATEDNKHGATDDIAWCSSFACYCVEMAGYKSTNSKSARSWLKWGKSVDTPIEGDIVVFWRGSRSAATGHVAFFVRKDSSGNIVCLGGNQSNQVCIATYSKDQVLGFRRFN